MQGQNTFQFQRWSQLFADAQERSFTIVYRTEDGEERTLDLIAPSPEIFKLWYSGLNHLLKTIDEKKKKFSLDALYLKSLWERADSDHSGTLTSKEVIQLISSININLAADTIRQMYAKFDIDQNGLLDFDEFVEFMTFLRKRCGCFFLILSLILSNYSLIETILKLFGTLLSLALQFLLLVSLW